MILGCVTRAARLVPRCFSLRYGPGKGGNGKFEDGSIPKGTCFSKLIEKTPPPGLTDPALCAKIILALDGDRFGEVSEWFMELVLKTSDSRERTMGSNPILSAIL